MVKMRKCKSCGAEISSKGKVACPSCGRVHKKPFYTRWWFILLVLIIISGGAAGRGGDANQLDAHKDLGENVTEDVTKNENTSSSDQSKEKQANTDSSNESNSEEKPKEQTVTYDDISVNVELGNGNYIIGVDIPEGRYDIEAISGGGNVTSSNMFTGGINAIMGTLEEDKAMGGGFYEQLYQNITLEHGDTLSISGVIVKLTCDKASGKPLETRKEFPDESVTLGNGNFIAGTDFPVGYYTIVAEQGGGNVSSSNMFDDGINAIMGTKEEDAAMGGGFYEQSYYGIKLSEGVELSIDGVKIKLIPVKFE